MEQNKLQTLDEYKEEHYPYVHWNEGAAEALAKDYARYVLSYALKVAAEKAKVEWYPDYGETTTVDKFSILNREEQIKKDLGL